MKTCTKCKKLLSVDNFTRRKNVNGDFVLRQPQCKRCRQDSLNAWRAENPEKVRASTRRQTKRRSATAAAWRKAHPDRSKEIARNWRRKNLRYMAEYEAARRIKKRGFEPYSRQEVFERDEGVCWVCNKPIDWALSGWDQEGFTVDHLAPISKGGTDTIDNVKSAHRRCNTERGNRIGQRVLTVERREISVGRFS